MASVSFSIFVHGENLWNIPIMQRVRGWFILSRILSVITAPTGARDSNPLLAYHYRLSIREHLGIMLRSLNKNGYLWKKKKKKIITALYDGMFTIAPFPSRPTDNFGIGCTIHSWHRPSPRTLHVKFFPLFLLFSVLAWMIYSYKLVLMQSNARVDSLVSPLSGKFTSSRNPPIC